MLRALRIVGEGIVRPAPLTIIVNGEDVTAYPGETVATALLASGNHIFRRGASGDARQLFCNMGVCFECRVTIDGLSEQRACMTLVRSGMVVTCDE